MTDLKSRYDLHCQIVFPTNETKALNSQIGISLVASRSAGWCAAPWPGETSWPFTALIPGVLHCSVMCTASDGQGWIGSAWPGKGIWPFCLPNKSLHCQYQGQKHNEHLHCQSTNFLAKGQTNLGSANNSFCTRDYCSSGVYVEESWMFKSLFSQVTAVLRGYKRLRCSILSPVQYDKVLSSQVTEITYQEKVFPCQIYTSTIPLEFNDYNLHSQYHCETPKTIHCQWKKRPF